MSRWILYILIVLNLSVFLWFYNQTPSNTGKGTKQERLLVNSRHIQLVTTDSKTIELQKMPVENSDLNKEIETESDEQQIDLLAAEKDSGNPFAEKSPEIDDLSSLLANNKLEAPTAIDNTNQNKQIVNHSSDLLKEGALEQPKSKQKSKDTQQIKPERENNNSKQENIVLTAAITEPAPEELVENNQLSIEELKLVNEMASFTKEEGEEGKKPMPQLCYQFGPLSEKHANNLTEKLREQQFPVVQQSRIETIDAGFLVLISPKQNSAAATLEMKQAKQAGLDAFTITKGEWLNGVSLGIFSSRVNAESLQKTAKKLLPKSAIELKPRVREISVYRVIFSLDEDQNPEKFTSSGTFPPIDAKNRPKVAKKSCKSVEF